MEGEKNFKIIVSYDGTLYSGWQVQPNGTSIQEKLEEALHVIFKEKIHVTGSGRTDAGVHAHKQTANFKVKTALESRRLLRSLNGLLPQEIRILEITEVDISFHARFDVKKKCYAYRMTLGPVQPPHWRHFSWHVPWDVNLPAMQEAASYLIGTHNFAAFTNESPSKEEKDLIRNINRIEFIPWEYGTLIEFEGDGFLYKMVRNIVGTLVDVGASKIPPEHIKTILSSLDRRTAGPAAPPLGLSLSYVVY